MAHQALRHIAINILALGWLLILAGGAYGAGKAGTVTHVSGPLFAKKADGSTRVLSVNSEVEEGDTLVTEKGTYGRIKFIDNSEITLRPNTQIKITHYSFNKDKPKDDNAIFDLAKGGLRAVTGLVGKRGDPDSYRMNAPTGTIGIRGTAYDVALCYNNCGTLPNGLYLSVISGTVLLTNNTGSQSFTAGQYGYVQDKNTKPVILPQKPALNFTLPSSVTTPAGKGQSSQGGSTGQQTDCIVR